MDPAHCRDIHFHLTRALMHLNSISGFLPFFEPAVDCDEADMTIYRRPSLHASQFRRHLQTLAPIPSESSIPTLSSHGGMPTHMVVNPEPHLRPLSTRPESEIPSSDSRPMHHRVGSSSTARVPNTTATTGPFLESSTVSRITLTLAVNFPPWSPDHVRSNGPKTPPQIRHQLRSILHQFRSTHNLLRWLLHTTILRQSYTSTLD